MPSSLGGLALFVALLAPGFVYSSRRERRVSARSLTTLRETGIVVMVSLACNVAVLGLLAIVGLIVSSADGLAELSPFLSEPGSYTSKHPGRVFVWSVALVSMSCVFAHVAAEPPVLVKRMAVRLRADRLRLLGQWLERDGPQPIAYISGWSKAFHADAPAGAFTLVGLELTDDTYIEGPLLSFNPQIGEDNDRSIVLCAPLRIRRAGKDVLVPLDVHRIVIAAGTVRFMTVSFVETLGD